MDFIYLENVFWVWKFGGVEEFSYPSRAFRLPRRPLPPLFYPFLLVQIEDCQKADFVSSALSIVFWLCIAADN